jgi:hypothetical protein
MRAWWCLGLLTTACISPSPLGAYRLPVQSGAASVELHTFLASIDGSDLVLFDVGAGKEFARGHGQLYSQDGASPYQFTAPSSYPLSLELSAGVLQDVASRPYKTLPISPMDLSATSVTRVSLTSGTELRTLVTSGGVYYSDLAEQQPAVTDLPGPLFVLGSVAGTGLIIPVDAATTTTWHDAMTTLAPSDPAKAAFCGAPLIATIRSTLGVSVQVPAGTFQAMQITETIDACQQPHPADVLVYEMDRWFVAGVGPVKMTYKGADAKVREYDLVSSQVSGDAAALWPLQANNRWTYQVHGPDGAAVGAPVDVTVSAVNAVPPPK